MCIKYISYKKIHNFVELYNVNKIKLESCCTCMLPKMIFHYLFLIQIVFDDEKYGKHVLTTEEIKEACKDVKVLGKSDIKWGLQNNTKTIQSAWIWIWICRVVTGQGRDLFQGLGKVREFHFESGKIDIFAKSVGKFNTIEGWKKILGPLWSQQYFYVNFCWRICWKCISLYECHWVEKMTVSWDKKLQLHNL